jgi:hypothetical protein
VKLLLAEMRTFQTLMKMDDDEQGSKLIFFSLLCELKMESKIMNSIMNFNG